MARYRKKPVIIEAYQWHIVLGEGAGVILSKDGKPYCKTLEGPLWVSDGDWIITGVEGEVYPCKPDIFEKTYELVEDNG